MERHPIPQNITGFEFKLIGDMTIKQFAYLAACALLAYLLIASPLYIFVKIPLALFIALLGIGLAFIPVEGRPLDRWISNFIRALFSPSQYIFHKQGGSPDFYTIKTKPLATITKNQVKPLKPAAKAERFNTFFASVAPVIPPTAIEQEEQKRLATITQTFNESFPSSSQPPSKPTDAKDDAPVKLDIPSAASQTPVFNGVAIPLGAKSATTDAEMPMETGGNLASEHEAKARAFEEENRRLKAQLQEVHQKLAQMQLTQPQPPSQNAQAANQGQALQEALTMEKQLQEALTQKEQLSSELGLLKRKTNVQPPQNAMSPGMMAKAPPQSQHVKIIPPDLTKQTGITGYSQQPNIIAGIVKDTKGDILPNIIVEVKDGVGNPVRAFKTSKLGQFSASTSLQNGTYTIELEDPKGTYSFDIIQITLTGVPLQPLEIIARNQAMGEREKLYDALFKNKTAVPNYQAAQK